MKKVNLVLAVYKEDLSWLERITNPEVDITLINKGIHEEHDKAKCITIKNTGVCDHSFSYYISNFYDDLYDYTIFSQGNPFDHYKNMIEFINNKEYEKGFIPLADLLIHIPPGEGTTIFVEGLLDYKFNGINFPAGAQYCVTKDRILAKPKKFWDDILNYLPWEEDHFTPYFMERTWFLLYDSNVDINKDYLNSPYFYKYKESNGK